MQDVVGSGGMFARVGILVAECVLILFSLLSVAMMIERALTLRRIKKIEEADYLALKDMLNRGQEQALLASVAASQAPSAAALQSGLDLRGANPDLVHEAVTQQIEVESAVLHHNLPVLATVASTAPYVGLFGTVLGILAAFQKIAATGQTGASAVAGPIAEALITTALGLGVAIPAVIAYNYFSGRVNDLSLRIETHALDLAARLARLQASDEASGGAALTHGSDSHAR